MKQIISFLLAFTCMYATQAQTNDADKNAALQLVSVNRVALGLSADQLNNLIVSDSYQDNQTGIRYVYLQQTYKDIPVYNQIQVITFRNNKVLSNSGNRIAMIDQKVNVISGSPSISAESAVMAAISDRRLTTNQTATVLNRKDNGRTVEFGNMGLSRENIKARLMWVPDENGKSVKLAWQVQIIPITASDYWLVRIDATSNSSLGADNLTVYCNWDDPNHVFKFEKNRNPVSEISGNGNNLVFDFKPHPILPDKTEGPTLADNVDYRVIPYPAEAPSFPGGTHAIITNPWTAATANATTLKWHSTAVGTDFNYTRGNNVWAYQDRSNQNFGDPTRSATSSTALPNLTFNFIPDYTQAPTTTSPPNQQFNITNLFYWNNIIHDVMYAYGFDEPAGNFQTNNLGRGGIGNDHVLAEAQDGGGSNNANFSTPSDGSSGRMQMYLWTSTTPNRDGDVDNGVIVHEFGHGISNRLTGGPSNSSCLGNAEQMGEGWSDYYALMFTQDWPSSNLNSGFTNPRGIGTYVENESPSGLGIRSQKYCTDFTVNNKVYAASIPSEPHSLGEIWCATLWDMTWNIIQQEGIINPNIYNLAGGGGNNIALKLVTEGLKLQPCSPGFISGRDAIIQADINLYGGVHVCAIKEAFRRRGMGDGASEGSTNSVTDQVPSFVGGGGGILTLLQNGVSTTAEGQNINYTNRFVVGSCGAVSNYKITDTLPSNVTFVSATAGGIYNAGNRVVSWTVNQAASTTADYNFVVNINAGAYHVPVTLLNEIVAGPPPSIPASWTTTSTPTNNPWVSTNTQSHSASYSFFTSNLTSVNDQQLFSTNSIALPASPPTLTFWGYINSEPQWDGGVVEISTNGGTTWSDLGSKMTSGGYNGTLNSSGNPLSGRPAFTGNSAGFVKTTVQLSSYAGQNVKFRFRFGSDASVAAIGWYVDDILLQDIAHVDMRSNLINASSVRVSFSDSIMLIDPPAGCTPPAINSQPASSSVCANANTSFTVSASGTAPLTYQWQLSTTGAGGPWNIANGGVYSGAATVTLSLTGVTAGMTGYQYRCIVTGQCAPTATSNPATLTVSANSNAGSVSGNSPLCVGATATYTSIGDPAGTWSSSAPGIATVNVSSGLVTAVSAGSSTITYTVNGCNGPATASKNVIVNALPQGNLSANGPFVGSGMGMLTWTATAGSNPFTVIYNDGSGNRTASGVTSGVPFNVFSSPVTTTTTYTVVSVSDANCTRSSGFTGGSATITITGGSCSGYIVLGLTDVNLGESNSVNGNIGNTGQGKKVQVNKNSTVNGLIRASVIQLHQPVTVTGGTFSTPAVVSLPPMLLNTAVVPGGGFTVPDNATATIINNYNSLTIGKNATVNINGTIYGTILINEGAAVTFTAGDINIDQLTAIDGKPSPLKYTTINFNHDANVRIKNTVTIGARNRINESSPDRVTFYLGDQNIDAEKFTINGTDTRITAGIYIAVGNLAINNNGPCIMTGTYIAQNITSTKNVTWNCGNSIPLEEQEGMITNIPNAEFFVKVFPNPSSDEFRIEVSGNSNEPVTIRIVDAVGREISVITNSISKHAINIGKDLPAGVYFARVMQGDHNTQTVKLVKQ